MFAQEHPLIVQLIRTHRQAALATVDGDGMPFAAMVAYAYEPASGGVLLHLSTLAAHTRHLLANPRAALLIAEQDDGRDDVQTLARITLTGSAQVVALDDPAYAAARACYLERLPAAAMLFGFGDFSLFRLMPERARYVGGFARAYTLTALQLRELMLSPVVPHDPPA